MERVTQGEIIVKGINLNKIRRSKIPLLRRSVGFVFQDFKLLSYKTAFENVAFALEVIGLGRREIAKKASHALDLVGLEEKMD